MYIPVALIPFILFLALGFVKKDGWFRAAAFAVKLICYTIVDSNILRPVGFFVAGVLCFAISFIYSKLEKNMANDVQ